MHLKNTFTTLDGLDSIPLISVDVAAPLALLEACPAHAETPLTSVPDLAAQWGVGHLDIKDERGRMNIGSFKALGAAYVIAHEASQAGFADDPTVMQGRTFVSSTAGNHGVSIAAGAKVFGAKAVIYISKNVPTSFADRLRGMGAEVVVHGDNYEASMDAAMQAAKDNDWTLLSDTSWDAYTALPHRLMEGYLVLAAEAVAQMPEPPTHIMLQAGVGGLASAAAAYFRHAWGDGPRITVVEPEFAPALINSVKAGKPVVSSGPVSDMGRLDCKDPSHIALKALNRDASDFVTITEDEGFAVLPILAAYDLATSTSGGAGVAAIPVYGQALGMDTTSRVLCILSEGPA
ncbi:pyridoxal-phosphate dependent enzyme [Algirhabdus cladophorae]|uniref:pyridoxal-phosphate dependent enzyme n=1 Tax=Algirhabdus cladophorae TaxID=3377108 RepID=UPI003B84AFA5